MKNRLYVLVSIFLCVAILLGGCGSKEEDTLADTYIEIAQGYIDDGNYDAAVEILQKATEVSDSKDIQELLVEALQLQAAALLERSNDMQVSDNKTNNEIAEEDTQSQINYMTSTPENDTDMGMRNVKIDSTDVELTDDQRLIREYFDSDYLTVGYYDDLQRYPDAYDNAQICISGTVEKVIASTSDKFEILLRTYDITSDTDNDYVYICGTQSNVRIIQGDAISVYGRYTGIQTITVDGTSYVIPSINSYRTFFDGDPKFNISDIKKVATLIFGDAIEVRSPKADETAYDPSAFRYLDSSNSYVVELEDKSNSRFDRFMFGTYDGFIGSVKDENSTITRTVEFMQDLQHFLVISHDGSLHTAEVTCYDTDLNRVWSRSFENVGTYFPYDFTKNNVYIATNNKIYIINAETGEDTFEPVYIGEKAEIRKLQNGILAFSTESVDPVMFLDLTGNISWTTNIEHCIGINKATSVQIINDRIVAQCSFVRAPDDYIIVIDVETGELILSCTPSLYY